MGRPLSGQSEIINCMFIDPTLASNPPPISVIRFENYAGCTAQGTYIYKPINSGETNYDANTVSAWGINKSVNPDGEAGFFKFSDGTCYKGDFNVSTLPPGETLSALTIGDVNADRFETCAQCANISAPARFTIRNWRVANIGSGSPYSMSTNGAVSVDVPFVGTITDAAGNDFYKYEVTLDGTSADGVAISKTVTMYEPVDPSDMYIPTVNTTDGVATVKDSTWGISRDQEWKPFSQEADDHPRRGDEFDGRATGDTWEGYLRSKIDAILGTIGVTFTSVGNSTGGTDNGFPPFPVPAYDYEEQGNPKTDGSEDWVWTGNKDDWFNPGASTSKRWDFATIPWTYELYFPRMDATIYGATPGFNGSTYDDDVDPDSEIA